MTIAKRVLWILVSIFGAATAVLLARSEASHLPAARNASLLFVCQNGVAMSVWSALTFNRAAAERGLQTRATSRAAAATFTAIPTQMRFALLLEGYRLGGYEPRVVAAADLEKIQRVILIDTQLPATLSTSNVTLERWGDFPPMREKYWVSRTVLETKVTALVGRMASLEHAAEAEARRALR